MLSATLLALLALQAPTARADAPPADAGPEWYFRHQVAASYFPLGLRYAGYAQYEIPLWNKDSVLFEDTYVAPGLYIDATPAYFHVGPRLHWAPIAIFELEAQAEYGYYFGTFSGVTDFYSAADAYTDEALDALEAAGHRNSGSVYRASISPTLQARVGPLIIALPQQIYWFWKPRPEGTPCAGDSGDYADGDDVHDCVGDYWYEPQMDAMLAWRDTIILNGAVAFWSLRDATEEDRRRLWIGLRFDHQYVLGTDDQTARLGPIAVFRPTSQPAMPIFAVFTQAYLASRTHPTFPPYIAAAAIWSH